jgi:short-subunit dehydrogenase
MGVAFDFCAFLLSLAAKLVVDVLVLAFSPFIFCFERHLSDKVKRLHTPRSILITGASSGIGRALAIEWAAPGVSLFLTARSVPRLAEVRELCTALGAEVQAEVVDVEDAAAMAAVVTRAEARKPLEIVVANAGVSASSLLAVLGTRELAQVAAPMLATNVQGVWNTLLPALPFMRKRRAGQLVVVASAASFTPLPGSLSYHATKMAARGLGEGLRAILRADNVGVTVLCPGLVESGMTIGEKGCISAAVAARIFRDGVERNVGVVTATHERTVWAAWVVGALHPVVRDALFGLITTKGDAKKQLGAV